MKNRTRKLIAFLLTLVMMVNIMPVTSFTEGEESGTTIVSQPKKTELRGAGEQNYPQVDMEYHVEDMSGLANYYVVVGPSGKFRAKNICTEMSLTQTYGFTEIENSEDYFVVLKSAGNTEEAQDQFSGNTAFYFSRNTTPIGGSMDIVDGRYTVTWSKESDHHYKMVIKEKVTKHKATVIAPADFDFDNLYLVFEQDGTYNVKAVSGAGVCYSDESFKFLWENKHASYDSMKPTTVRLVTSSEYDLVAENAQYWQIQKAADYTGGGQYDVSIVTTGDETTVTISEASHKVALRFYDGDATEATTHTLPTTDNYTLTASDGTITYTAVLNGNSEILSFTRDDGVSVTELPKISTWSFTANSSAVTNLDGYELPEGPVLESNANGNVYVWNVRKPKQYKVNVEAYDEYGVQDATLKGEYTLKAITDAGTYTGALGISTDLQLTCEGKSYLSKVNSFEIRDSGNSILETVEGYKIVYPDDMNPSDGVYVIQLKKPRTCTASIEKAEEAGLNDGDYYIVAYQNGTATGYYKITETAPQISFTNLSNTSGSVTINEETAFSVVKVENGTTPTDESLVNISEENSATSAPMNQGSGKIGENNFTWKLQEATGNEAPKYTFTVTKQTLPADVVRAVNINLYSYDGTTRVNDGNATDDLKENLSGKKFVVVARLEDKSTTDPKKMVIGYQTKDVEINGSGQYQGIYFNGTFKGVHFVQSEWTEYYQDDNADVTYNPDTHRISIRLYEIAAGSSSLYAQYNDIIRYSDTVTGYQFKAAPNGNTTSSDGLTTTLNLQKAYPLKYQVKLKFNEAVELTEADDVCLKVEVQHASGDKDVYFGKVVGSGTEITVVLEDQSTNPATKNWTSGGNGLLTGNEDYTIQIVTGSAGQSDSQAQAPIAEGGYAAGYTVSYTKTARTQVTVQEEHASVITDYIDFTKVKASNDTNYLAILGQGVNFAITADSFEQKNHIQANFATNLYKSTPQPIEPDLNANATGSVVIAKVDPSGNNTIQIGQKTPGTLLVYINEDDLDNGVVLQDDSKKAVKIPSDGDTLTNTIVEPIITHMEKMSAALNKPATFTPAKPIGDGQVMVIDTTSFGDDDTIYINGDDIKDYINGSDKLKIQKKDNQTIVFNFNNTDNLTIGQFLCTVDGDTINSSSPVSSTDPKNEKVDKIAQRIVWNCVNCSNVNVINTTGIFLLPKDNNTFDITGTSSGWIISDGKVVNSGGEWHGVYRNMTSYDKATLNARKTIENNSPKASEKFVFQVYRYDPDSPDADEDGFKLLKNGDEPLEAVNNGETVAFTISEYEMGLNTYKIVESRVADGVNGSYTISDAVYFAEFEVIRHEDVNLTVVYPGLPKYYASFDTTTERCAPGTEITGTPVFDNAINREGLTLQKVVQGVNAPDALFNFKVELWQEVLITAENQSEYGTPESRPEIGTTVIVPVTGIHAVTGAVSTESLNFTTNNENHGVATIALHQNETAKIADLEVGTKYMITEVSANAGGNGDTDVQFEDNKANGYTSIQAEDSSAAGEITLNGNAIARFVNQYESSATADFKVRKTMAHGTLENKQFTFRLTQVKSGSDLTQAETNVKLTAPVLAQTTEGNTDISETVLLSNLKFTNADDGKDFWFLIEEVVPGTAVKGVDGGYQYDTKAGTVIKLHVSDDKQGNLTVTRDPARAGSADFDVEYTNDKLGSVEVTKAFVNAPSLPDDFKITATYEINNEQITRILKIGAGSDFPVSGRGTAAEPFKWTIPDLPVGTVVTFEETGTTIEGYTDTATIIKKASNDENETRAAATAVLSPDRTGFVNTYTRDYGSLRILKKTTVNDVERTDTTLVDGTYTFTIASVEGLKPEISKQVMIKIENGAVTEVTPSTDTDPDITLETITENGKTTKYAKISNLPTGKYTVTEDTTGLDAKHITLAEEPEEEIEVIKDDTGDIPTAAFRNDYEAGELQISKTVVGTSSKAQEFHFEVTLTPPSGVTLKSTYPATKTSGNSSETTTVTVSEGNRITGIILKADESLLIRDLPTDTIYTVKETDESIPAGYSQTKPADTAGGTITKTRSKAEFENTYNLDTASVSFGGLKTIEGTDTTTKQFFFELYETDSTYSTANITPVETHTSGTIGSAGGSYAFEPIIYDESSLAPVTNNILSRAKEYYYVIKEKAFNTTNYPAEGWSADDREYKRHVVVSDGGNGKINVEVYDETDAEVGTEGHPVSMDFTNAYQATGSVEFSARKVFTDGKLHDHPFNIALTQVQGEGSEKPVTGGFSGTIPLDTNDSTQTVRFGDRDEIAFTKNSTQDDTKNNDGTIKEYWFLIQETDTNQDTSNIEYDANQKRWIKVTLTDNGKGELIPTKSPSAINDGAVDLDAVFTNRQLGSVKVTKVFQDAERHAFTNIPPNFKITATYKIGNTDYSKELTTANVDKDSENNDIINPYTWTIDRLPLNTKVTFTENGITVDGYTVTTEFNDTAVPDQTAPAGTVQYTGKDQNGVYPVGAFVNTYTRDTGSLKIRKNVTLNGDEQKAKDTKLVDGDYTFTLTGTGLAAGTTKNVTISIKDGVIDTVDGGEMVTENGVIYARITNLPTGQYTVTETTNLASLGINLAAKPETALTVEKNNENSIPTAAFTNNKDIGELEISKDVSGTTDNTSDFSFTVTLAPPTGMTLADKYPVAADADVKDNNTDNTTTQVTSIFDNDNIKLEPVSGTDKKTVTVKLRAEQKIIIKDLPAGTTYVVHENLASNDSDYEQTDPAGDAQDTIGTGTSKAAFINTYKKNTTSVTFGGVKHIEGTDSTEKVFSFSLYETGSDYSTTGTQARLLETVSTTGTIGSAGQNYSFRAITYDDTGDHYYVIKEEQLSSTEGWGISSVEYQEHVHVYKDTEHNNMLTRTVKRKLDSGTEEESNPGGLDFMNTYEANGNVTFNAKKILIGDNLNNHAFKIKLTQVTGEGSTTQATVENTPAGVVLSSAVEKTVTAEGNTQTVSFGKDAAEKIGFTKNKIRDDTRQTDGTPKEYWFLLEEEIPSSVENGIKDGVRYEQNAKKWIKVTLTDEGDGILKATKHPAADTDDLDVTFTNEQLGGVRVSKAFTLNGATVPEDFQIKAEYTADETAYTKILKIHATDGEIAPLSGGEGTTEKPYVWEINDLPLATKVTFTESGIKVDGYTLTVSGATLATDKETATTGQISPQVDPAATELVNTYTRDTGSLKIKKTVTVNGAAPSAEDYALVAGTYSFTVTEKVAANATTKTVSINISNMGEVTASVDGVTATPDQDGYVLIDNLPTGMYELEETGLDALKLSGIIPTAPSGGKTTLEVKKNPETIPTTEFKNNKDIGELEIKKTVIGTENPPQSFTFEITLTPPTGVALTDSYLVNTTDDVKNANREVITAGKIKLSDGTNGKKTATVLLKNGESLTIKQLPAGTTYTVHEDTSSLPSGYTKTSPAGDDTDTIIKNKNSVSAFVNNYDLAATSVTFGGTKMIEGRDSTTQEFVFELYSTGEDFKVDSNAKLLDTVKITGTINNTTGKTFSFKPIVYDKPEDVGPHYYVVREKPLTPSSNGWRFSTPEYHETVNVTSTNGTLSYTASPEAANQLNFTNTYTAQTNVTFKAKKVFTDGNLKEHPFKIRLTQVTGDKSETQATTENGYRVVLSAPIEKVVDADADNQTIILEKDDGEKISFLKTKDWDDTTQDYWFLLEEIDENPDKTGVRNDEQTKRWIKVSLTDNGKGRLIVTKEPAADANALDAIFENKQLGSVKVTKAFKDAAGNPFPVPKDFRITARYTIDGEDHSVELTKDDADQVNGVIVTDPYTWTINDLPLTTEVTFTESGIKVDGYTLTVSGATLATDEETATTGQISPQIHPAATELVNTYARDTGSLKIRKTLTLNGSTTIADADYSLVDGIYKFRVKSNTGVEPETDVLIDATLSKGQITGAEIDASSTKKPGTLTLSGDAKLSGLPTGKYTVTEELTDEQKGKGISLTAKPESDFTVVKDGDGVTIATADFTNNRNVGNMEISKTVKGTSDKTKDFTFKVTLTPPTGVVLDDAYPVDTSDPVQTRNASISGGKITLSATTPKTVEFKLRADEKIVIRNLPENTEYTVQETGSVDGYQQIYPSGNATGNIEKNDNNEVGFINQYNLSKTSVTFGGKKTISGTESTGKQFTFELFKTDEQFTYNTQNDLLQTKTLSGAIGKNGRDYSFDSITYIADDKGKIFYYLIKEAEDNTDGWTTSTVVYHVTVVIEDNGSGALTTNVTTKKVNGSTEETIAGGESRLNFENTYEAKGGVTFKAKKIFTDGDLSENGKTFTFKLTQVTGENETTPAISNLITIPDSEKTKTIHTDTTASEQVVAFSLADDAFVKKDNNGTLRDDTKNEYWFLLEEDTTSPIAGVRYDASPKKWIKVTLTDEGDGTLKATKHPAADANDLDVTFTNEQLGGVKVSKVFEGAAGPDGFQITAKYTVDGTEYTKILKINATHGEIAPVSGGQGTTEKPYVWEINDLPVGTDVTFTESGMTVDGYSLTGSFTDTAGKTTETASGTVKAAYPAPAGAFVNEYTRNKGSLKIKKTVTVNGAAPSAEDYALVAGTYSFTVTEKVAANATTKAVSISISNKGEATASVDGVTATPDQDGYVLIDNLPTGKYDIAENGLTDLSANGILPTSPTGGKTTVEVTEDPQTIPTIEFKNNKDIGKLEISKTLKRSSNHEKEFEFTVEVKNGNTGISGTYPVTWTLLKGKSEGTIELNESGQATVKLHADESVVIRQLPAGANYKVTEVNPGENYTQTNPASGTPAVGSIAKGETAQAAFENTYNLKGTNVTFGGRKSIEVASRTKQQFNFELYETDENYVIGDGQPPLRTATIDGEITDITSTNFDFETITYEVEQTRDPNQNLDTYKRDYYYVVCETKLDENGWKNSEELYQRHVVIKNEKQGENDVLVKHIYDGKTGQEIGSTKGSADLNFTNTYKAIGTISFKARKLLKNGDLNSHPFTIRLTQVDGKNSTTQATGDHVVLAKPISKVVSSGNVQTVTFTESEIGLFVKQMTENGKRDDTEELFWFLLEELVPSNLPANRIDGDIKFDTVTQKWIKVTLKDDDKGNLVATREPAAGADGLDADFINEQGIRIQKTDIATGEELTGAHIQILDSARNVIEEWDSVSGQPHMVFDLQPGEYTLHESVAPTGYTIAAETHFTITDDFRLTTCDTVVRDSDGVLLVRDAAMERSAAIRKVWDDDDNRDGLRPASLTITLLANGAASGRNVTLNAANHWTARLDNLPAMLNGEKITYTWQEPTVGGYTLKSSRAEDGILTTLTNTHTPDKTAVSVTKVWKDGNNAGNTRPASIQVQLFADGLAAGGPVTLNAENGWAYTWQNLNRNICENGTSRAIRYTVAETEVPAGYVSKVTGSAATGFVITNSRGRLVIEKNFDIEQHNIEVEDEEITDFEVRKFWVGDNDDADGNRPEYITVRLYAGGTEIKVVKLTAKNGWKYHFGKLPKYENERPIHYSIKEDPVEGYATEIDGFRIYNKYQPERMQVTVKKVWNDGNNEKKTRPASIRMKLNNGMSVVLNESNGWMATITGLPTRVDGKPAGYTWTEQTVLGYMLESTDQEGTVTKFTNKLWTRPDAPSQGRTPKTAGDTVISFEEYDTPLGVEIVINHVGDCFD